MQALERGVHLVADRIDAEHTQILLLIEEARRPTFNHDVDWLYHKETVLAPSGRFYRGVKTGLADPTFYSGVLVEPILIAPVEDSPDVTDVLSIETGHPSESGTMFGFQLGSYRIGMGMLTLNLLRLTERARENPYAERILINLLEYMQSIKGAESN